MRRMSSVCRSLLCLVLASNLAYAHLPEDSYLYLSDTSSPLQLSWDISGGNLAELIDALPANKLEGYTADELRGVENEIWSVAAANLSFTQAGAACDLSPVAFDVVQYSTGPHASLKFAIDCLSDEAVTIEYRLLQGIEAGHRGVLMINWNQGNAARHEFFEGRSRFQYHPAAFRAEGGSNTGAWGAMQTFRTYVFEGIRHIAIGLDHILFVICLLLTAVLVWREGQWVGASNFRLVVLETVKLVTAFTLAHSITLTIAALGWVSLPAALVEAIIALSVLVLAVNNIRPFLPTSRWHYAFLFGLLHGFGFASVLGELGLAERYLLWSLAGFNIGVEVGQLIIVLALIPLLYLMRHWLVYRKLVMPGVSFLIALLAAVWFVERAFGLDIIGL